jgi:hypothetical protein
MRHAQAPDEFDEWQMEKTMKLHNSTRLARAMFCAIMLGALALSSQSVVAKGCAKNSRGECEQNGLGCSPPAGGKCATVYTVHKPPSCQCKVPPK